MGIKEKLERLDKEVGSLSNRIDQKRRLEDIKEQLSQFLLNDKDGAKLKEMLVDTGLLDMLSEAVDHIPMVEVIKGASPSHFNCDFFILLQWDKAGEVEGTSFSCKELMASVDKDTVCVHSHSFCIPARDDLYRPESYFSDELKPEQWQNKERLESSIADALWMAGIRPKPV